MLAKQSALIGRLTKAISAPRLDTYYDPRVEERWEALSNYAWNVAICEAFYPLLHAIEIVLRNSLDAAISTVWYPSGRSHVRSWLDATPSRLNSHGQSDVKRAKEKIFGVDRATGSLKTPTRTVLHCDLVAALDFGFWTGLLHKQYNYRSPSDQRLWPHLLGSAFPHHPTGLKHVSAVTTRFSDVRHFRNRVFHHEPIWHRSDLSQMRDEIIGLIAWMSPESSIMLRKMERVSAVLDPEYRRALRARVYVESRQ